MRNYHRLARPPARGKMSSGCGTAFAKYCLCLFNFVFFLAGAAVLAVGIWIAVDKHSFIQVANVIQSEELRLQFQQFTQPTVIEQASYILIAAGAFMFVVSFLGYCGALRESKCLLTCYGVFLVIILIMEITAGSLAAAYKNEARDETEKFLKSTIEKYYASNQDAVTLMWDYINAEFKCCGVQNWEDFKTAPKWNATVPRSCCILDGDIAKFQPKYPACPASASDQNSYWMDGCYNKFLVWVDEHIRIVIGVGIGLGLLQLIGIFLAFCLSNSIDSYIK